MKPKHTPGPWTIEKSEFGDHWVRQPGIAGFSICLIGHPEQEANARLIAAAPDLLFAAKDAVESCPGYVRGFHDIKDECSFCMLLKEAIAKAEGNEK
jgi:hypothetical protein